MIAGIIICNIYMAFNLMKALGTLQSIIHKAHKRLKWKSLEGDKKKTALGKTSIEF